MSEIVRLFTDLRKDMKNLVGELKKLNNLIPVLEKAIKSIDKLQKTMMDNEGNLTRLVDELEESNANIKTVLDVIKQVKE